MRIPNISGWASGLFVLLFTLVAVSQAQGDDGLDNGGYPSAAGHGAKGGYDVLTHQLQQLDLQAQLSNAAPAGSFGGFRILLSESEFAQIGQYQQSMLDAPPMYSERRYQVGVTKAVGRDVAFAALNQSTGRRGPSAIAMGVLERIGGNLVWESEFGSFDANAVRVHVSRMNLADGVAMYIYNAVGQAYGPYTGRGPQGDGELWSATLAGSEATIQLQSDSDAALRASRFTIDEISHIGPRFKLVNRLAPKPEHGEGFCGTASCVLNAGCHGGTEVSQARDSVAVILFSERGGSYICSGGLIADTDAGSERPLFLTANHCVSKGRTASSVEAFWDFEASCSSPDCTAGWNQAGLPTAQGTTILASNRSSDYTILEFSGSVPGGRAYLGWNSAPVAFNNGTDLYRISHPTGAPQAYSHHEVDTSYGTCSSWPRGNWIYSRDLEGATQGGSSGSPVLNSAGEVVGQLSGGCGTNVSDDCDPNSNATVDGALAAYYSNVAAILDPDTGGGGGGGGGGPKPCNPKSPKCNP